MRRESCEENDSEADEEHGGDGGGGIGGGGRLSSSQTSDRTETEGTASLPELPGLAY